MKSAGAEVINFSPGALHCEPPCLQTQEHPDRSGGNRQRAEGNLAEADAPGRRGPAPREAVDGARQQHGRHYDGEPRQRPEPRERGHPGERHNVRDERRPTRKLFTAP